MAPAAFTPVVSSDLRSASRDAQAALIEKFDSVSSGMSGDALSTLSDELARGLSDLFPNWEGSGRQATWMRLLDRCLFLRRRQE